jgi:hypothetical protein
MIKLTFEGSNVQQIIAEMLSVLNVQSVPGLVPATPPAPPPTAATKPPGTNGTGKHVEEPTTAAAMAKKGPGRPRKEPLTSETAPPTEEIAAAPPPVTSPDTSIIQGPAKSASDVRHDAVLVLKKVYTKGPQGQAKVDQVCKHFNVTKLVDVPLERADELFKMSSAALAELGG